jgi:predicted  nucleic acid-binding Zn-ribbon protein
MIDKCLNCGCEYVFETGDVDMPWGCPECGYWGKTADKVENPPPDDEWNPTGQVERRRTDDPEDQGT